MTALLSDISLLKHSLALKNNKSLFHDVAEVQTEKGQHLRRVTKREKVFFGNNQ